MANEPGLRRRLGVGHGAVPVGARQEQCAPMGRGRIRLIFEYSLAPWCVRTSLTLPTGESPAPARGRATPPGIEPWAYGGNDMS